MKNHHAQIHNESLALVEVKCEWCGTVEKEYESQLEIFGDNWYCQRECYNKAQSKRRTGRSLEENIGAAGAEKVRKHASEMGKLRDNSGKLNPMFGTTRELSNETKQKISESLKGREPPEAKWMFDDKLGHFTRSDWERKFGRLLQDSEIEYQYEGVTFEYDDGRKYYPDFVLPNHQIIIELKGEYWVDEDAISKAKTVLESDWRYVVIGAKLPSDAHYDWDKRAKAIEDL